MGTSKPRSKIDKSVKFAVHKTYDLLLQNNIIIALRLRLKGRRQPIAKD
jgi:hypothetical protein